MRIDNEGVEIAVRVAGDRAKRALLLIHGFPSSSNSFRNVIGALAHARTAPNTGTHRPERQCARERNGAGMLGDQNLLGRSRAKHEAGATAHLTLEGTRDQYVGGVPEDIADRIDPEMWEDDWRTMSLPGRLQMHRALV
jgi:pimeloyl-ACP methyl ester carboxylesterase